MVNDDGSPRTDVVEMPGQARQVMHATIREQHASALSIKVSDNSRLS